MADAKLMDRGTNIHDRDIHGFSWSPCAACPHPTPGSCPSRRHRPYCAHLAADPATWAPIIAAEPAEDRPARNRGARPAPPPFLPAPPDGTGRIRLGFVTPGLYVGGAERHMLDVARWLPADKFRTVGVAVVLQGESGIAPEMRAEWERLGVPIGVGPDVARALYGACDVAYVWGVPHDQQHIESRPASCKVVLVSHGICDWTANAMRSAPHADALVITAEASRRTIPDDQQARARTIHNATPPERVRPTLSRTEQRAAWGVPDGCRVIGTVSRVSGEKGPYAAPEAVAELWRRGRTEYRWVWVGPGREIEQVRDKARSLGVEHGLILPGGTEDVGSALAAFDVFCLPSVYDANPIATLEALRAGVPAISGAVGFATEIPQFVRLIPAAAGGSAIADAVLADEADPAATADRADRAQAYAAEHLSPARFGREWDALLSSLVPPRTSRGHLADISRTSRGHLADTGPTSRVPMPPLRRQVAGLVRTAGAVVSHAVATGEVRADATTVADRLAVCGDCDRFDAASGRCGACGCLMPVKAAARAATCPLGKWQ